MKADSLRGAESLLQTHGHLIVVVPNGCHSVQAGVKMTLKGSEWHGAQPLGAPVERAEALKRKARWGAMCERQDRVIERSKRDLAEFMEQTRDRNLEMEARESFLGSLWRALTGRKT